MRYNYQTICHSNLLGHLPDRYKKVMVRRFGLRGERETLESIGQSYGITRERVRPIEEDGLKKLEEKLNLPVCQKVFQHFLDYFKKTSSLKREDLLLEDLGGPKFKNHVYFLLTLGKPFLRHSETEDLHAFWTVDKNTFNVAQKVINNFIGGLKKKRQPTALPSGIPLSYIEISKNILKGQNNFYGLEDWPEINPRGVKDKAYIVFKKESQPLHFSRVAKMLGQDVIVQTVHNELIKDPRFVLVGRGTYALREWGYEPGFVREVITNVLEEAGRPLERGKVVDRVLKQRQVQPNTILLNLQNKKYFLKNPEGKYTTRKV